MIKAQPLLLAVGAGSVLATWALVLALIRYAPRLGLLDRPNERSLHTKVTPRGGGLGFVLTLTLGLGLGLLDAGLVNGARLPLLIYLGGSLFIAAISLRDDFKSLGAGVRFLAQLGAAVAAVAGVACFNQVTVPGIGPVGLGWAGALLTVVWIVGLTNVYNFMDGIDGIAGVQGLTGGLAWTLAGLWVGAPVVSWLGALLAGGCLGFLRHNWSPAKIFMGDVGSAFLGYSFAVLPLLLVHEAGATGRSAGGAAIPCFALLTMWPFVGDGFYTFFRRAVRGEAVWKPHRTHLYQRLVQSGWTHARVTSLYALWAVACGAAALYWLGGSDGAAVIAWGVPLVSLAGIFLLVRHRERQTKGLDA